MLQQHYLKRYHSPSNVWIRIRLQPHPEQTHACASHNHLGFCFILPVFLAAITELLQPEVVTIVVWCKLPFKRWKKYEVPELLRHAFQLRMRLPPSSLTWNRTTNANRIQYQMRRSQKWNLDSVARVKIDLKWNENIRRVPSTKLFLNKYMKQFF